jgi:predicted transcriptional regulator
MEIETAKTKSMKLPTNEQIIELLERGFQAKEIAGKFGVTYQSMQNRITQIHYDSEMEQHKKTRERTFVDKTEEEIYMERKFANPRVGDVHVVKGTMIHRYTGEILEF